jgi:vacuole morphology and inheritance protein 14
VQAKHEKTRRQAAGGDMSAPFAEYPALEERESGTISPPLGAAGRSGGLPRRKGDTMPPPVTAAARSGALSPLNPRARSSGILANALGGRVSGGLRPTSPVTGPDAQGKRTASSGRRS